MNSKLVGYLTSIGAYTVVPLIGVLFFGWDWRVIVVFYWLGNISTGVSAVIDFIKLSPTPANWSGAAHKMKMNGKEMAMSPGELKVFMIPFFCFHYGMFTFVHGFFVFMFVSGAFGGLGGSAGPRLDYANIFLVWLVGAVVQLLVQLFMPSREVPAEEIAKSVYARIIILHVSIIFGGFVIQLLQLPSMVAIMLIAVNFFIQMKSIKSMMKPQSPIPTNT